MAHIKDLCNLRFDKLLVVEYAGSKRKPSGQTYSIWKCLCDCGNYIIVRSGDLSSGNTKSCSCLKAEVMSQQNLIHGLSTSKEYSSYQGMIGRCTNPNVSEYPNYGAKRITVCDRWLEPEGKGFINFLEDMGERPEGTTLNRIQGAKIYSKETCEWASLSIQSYDQKKSIHNTSGRIGVCWDKTRNKWKSEIKVARKHIQLGRYSSFEEACEVREKAELKYYGFSKESR